MSYILLFLSLPKENSAGYRVIDTKYFFECMKTKLFNDYDNHSNSSGPWLFIIPS